MASLNEANAVRWKFRPVKHRDNLGGLYQANAQNAACFLRFPETKKKEGVFMQKTFIKYTFFILTAAILLILFINFLFSSHMFKSQQSETFSTKIDQMIHTLENNRIELELLNESLDEDYLTRARAAAYIFDNQEEVTQDVQEMQYLANLFNVDELHVIDENGIIVAGSVSQYVGIDMDDHPQTRAFLAILRSPDQNAYLIQETQPNAAEGKIMKYIGVAKKSSKGIVQVGLRPTRQMEAQSRNTYEYIFSKFPTDVGEEFYVVNASDGSVLGHSGGIDQNFDAPCYQLEQLKGCDQGAYKPGENGRPMYVMSRRYDDVLLCAALPGNIIFRKLWSNVLANLFYLLLIEAAVLLLLNYLVKQKVIDGIHRIIDNLDTITKGNLDTKVAVGGNREFGELSKGINTMVKSIISLSDRISAIIEISGMPLAAFEYEKGIRHIFATSGLKDLLGLSHTEAEKLYGDSALFDRYIRSITRTPIEGEADIYQISDSSYVCIHMSESADGYLGIITDVTKDVAQKKQMQYENTHDPLTGLYKFEHFKQLAAGILAQMPPGKVCAALMLDLDHFKSINDTYGHDTGDRYLQSFSAVMQSMPEQHFLCARRSGDEFCMLLHDCENREDVRKHLDMFYDTLRQNKVKLSDTVTGTISASCGFAWTADSSESLSDLLCHADEALYDMKRTSKGHYTEYIWKKPASPFSP